MNIEELKNGLKGDHFAWIGQNASTGTSHPQTGRMSMFGRYVSFTSRKERDQFVEEYQGNGFDYVVKCGIYSGREYILGISWRDYLEALHNAETPIYNESTGRWEQ